ncbi:ZIP family metal transporter [Sphingomonas carotinifaciens]|uniref:ZIP family metal transporter n=1 Tax=Sphingomonas carotinifaciens TaxID=1166323 RepID=UPI0039A3E17D
MHQVVTAGLWGLVGGSALILGAAIPYLVTLPQRLIAAIMAIGSGVLISAVAFDLMDEAYAQGGFDSTAAGFVGGAAVYTLANIIVSRQGARHRKRSGSNPQEKRPMPGPIRASPSRSARCSTGSPNRWSSVPACSAAAESAR